MVNRGVRLLVALALLAAAGVVVWRVLGPAEVLDIARDGYPPTVRHRSGVTGETAAAPLIVQGRIRVYAAKRQVRADAPVTAKTMLTPRWSYRRWPAQLNGVVAVGRTVITRWSDGRLTAIDAGAGTIAWRAGGPPAGGYTGLRTGAATVWEPPGLFTAGTTVIATGGGQIAAYAVADGRLRWHAATTTGCAGAGFTTAGGAFACGTAVYQGATGAHLPGWPQGPFTPLDCQVAQSGCGGFRAAPTGAWLASHAVPVRAPRLDTRQLAAGLALSFSPAGQAGTSGAGGQAGTSGAGGAAALTGTAGQGGTSGIAGLTGTAGQAGTTVIAGPPLTGAETWRWSAPPGQTVQLLGSSPGRVYLLTSARTLVTIRAATGVAHSVIRLAKGIEKTTWTPGLWQVGNGYAAVERLNDPQPTSVHHYFAVNTVIVAVV